MKRIIALALSLALLLGLAAGCSQESGSETAMGRYIEEQGPVLENVHLAGGLRRLENGDLSLLAQMSEESGLGYYRYVFPADGGEPQRTALKGLPALLGENGYVRTLTEGADGTIYVLYASGTKSSLVARSTDGVTFEPIDIPDLAAPQQTPEGGDAGSAGSVVLGGSSADISVTEEGGSVVSFDGQKYVSGILPLSDGFLLMFSTPGASRYSADGTLVAEYPGMPAPGSTAVWENTLIMLNQDSSALVTYDLETGRQSGTYSYDGLGFLTAVGLDSDGIFLADTTGIYRQSLDGKLWERLVDGGLTTLVMPNVTIAGLVGDGGDGFHALLSTGENTFQLMHYIFDPNTPTNPDTELTVFSLKDNSTIRQTIGEFQRRNPNVRVNFRVALDENASATTEDIIRSLNTEILSGNGPDILLLDGLPVDSYIEKGVLADITALIDRMVAENGLMSNLMGAYARDGKIYGAPARFTLPVMMGSTEEVAAVTSLEDLLKLTQAGEQDEPPFLRAPQTLWDEEGTGMLMEFYDVSASAFLNQDGVDEAALADYFRTVLALDESVKRYSPESNDAALTMVASVSSNGGGYEIVDMGAYDLQAGFARFHCTPLSGIYGLENICSNLSQMDYGLDSLFGRGQYTPVGAVGILSTSSQQELAASFVEMLLSPTVQDSYLSDGFPVNGSSLEKLVQETLTSEDGTVESDMGFLDLCGTLDTPILTDQVVKETVLDQISGLLSGSLTPEDAAAAVVEKVSLYLAE